MPSVGQILDRLFVAGDELTVEGEATSIPDGRTVVAAILAFFAQGDADSVAWVYVTGTETGAGQVTDDGAGGTALVTFRLTAAQTTTIGSNWRDYVFRVELDDNTEFTVNAGDIRGDPGKSAPVQASAP